METHYKGEMNILPSEYIQPALSPGADNWLNAFYNKLDWGYYVEVDVESDGISLSLYYAGRED
jgi:hypothetical protein